MNSQLITSASARSYLIKDNGWTAEEVNSLFRTSGTEARTEAAWEAAFQKEMEEGPQGI